jgi:hypothetical protein
MLEVNDFKDLIIWQSSFSRQSGALENAGALGWQLSSYDLEKLSNEI